MLADAKSLRFLGESKKLSVPFFKEAMFGEKITGKNCCPVLSQMPFLFLDQ